MALNYTHEFSNYPDECIELTNYMNVDDTISTLINQINTLRAAGNYNEATALITQYASQLRKYNLDCNTINAMVEEIRNTQIKALTAGQFLVISDEEPTVEDGIVWLGGD